MTEKKSVGHLAAGVTVAIWGTTFISTKVLLEDFSPVEILFLRFLIGFVILNIIHPRRLKVKDRSQEIYFAAAGLCGITLYYLLENIALTYTLASNAGVIVSITPFFTAVFAFLFLKEEKPKPQFFLGFLIAIAGIFLISFNGNMVLELNPLGDMLAVLAAVVWAIYSILLKKINTFGYNNIQSTRRIFSYGIVFMIPALFFMDFELKAEPFYKAINIVNIVYLGFGASAVCFLTWSFAVKILGAVKTSIYIYVVPVITVIASAVFLREQITWMALAGMLLTLSGLFLSEGNFTEKLKVRKRS